MVTLFKRLPEFRRRPEHRASVQFHQARETCHSVLRRFPARRRLRLVIDNVQAVRHGC